MNKLLVAIIAVVAAGAYACGSDAACTSDSDCFAREVCIEGACGPESSSSIETGPDYDMNNMTSGNNVLPDSGTTPSNNNAGTDAGGTDAGNNNTGMDMGTSPNNTAGTCVVDPFEVDACPDDGNDRFAERFEQRTVGCQASGFVPLDKTETFRFCAVEQADRYEVSMVECDGQTIRFEMVFKPLVPCDPNLINVELSLQGKRCSEQDQSPDIQCAWNADGEYVAQVLVRDMRSIASAQIRIETPDRSDIDFDYELTARVSQ